MEHGNPIEHRVDTINPNPISGNLPPQERLILKRLFDSREHFRHFLEFNFPCADPSERDDLVADMPYWGLVSRLVLITESLDDQLKSSKPEHTPWYEVVHPHPSSDIIADYDPLIDHILESEFKIDTKTE